MKKGRNITITHLYPNYLNLYGDRGNIIALRKRCEWRNIKVRINNFNLGSRFSTKSDLYFIGGGQDEDEYEVYKDLIKHRKQILKIVEDGVIFLCLCAGFQLFGRYFIDGTGRKIKGLGILDVKTKAPSNSVKARSIGNIIVELNKELFKHSRYDRTTLVGFENHIGQTFLGKKVEPLGKVIKGKGNNNDDEFEGAVYKHVFGTYLHGPILPKNPHFADYLIELALKRKYKRFRRLKKLDDTDEFEAHDYILQNAV